jgi:hypothetical protein
VRRGKRKRGMKWKCVRFRIGGKKEGKWNGLSRVNFVGWLRSGLGFFLS